MINFYIHLELYTENMRKWILPVALLLLHACREKEPDTYFTNAKALSYFRDVEEICNKDNGELWGKNLNGAVMYVDRRSRKVFANMQDAEGNLKPRDGIFTGTYPRELIIDNTNIMFGGTMYGMAPLPSEEDPYRIRNRAIHGLFHCFQKNEGLNPQPFMARKMDERNSRIWLKLEWRALKNAINSSGEERSQSLRDALIFRGARREENPSDIIAENKFEFYEGLATITYTILCSSSPQEARKNLNDYFDRLYKFQSFSRTYGYIHGALYSYLAIEKGYDIKELRSDTTDLALLVRNLYSISLPAICRDVAGSIALAYDTESIYKEEDQRLADIRDRLHRQIEVFTEKPVVFLELESPYFDFEPEDIRSLDTLGTIYNSIRVADNWGKLAVEKGGCLVSFDLRTMRITAKNIREEKNHIYGEGWHLILNPDWEIKELDENYLIRKLMP
jgi:hypothetical protein